MEQWSNMDPDKKIIQDPDPRGYKAPGPQFTVSIIVVNGDLLSIISLK
jgi:hypothetical protein